MSFPLMPLAPTNYTPSAITYTYSTSTSTNFVTYTYTAVALGTESIDRRIVVAAHTDVAGPTPISATVNGVNATLVVNNSGVGLFVANVPTGTSVVVTVTYSGTAARAALGVWALTNVSREAAITTNVATGTGTVATSTISVAGGSVVISAASHANSSGFTWTGGTERYDTANGNPNRMSGADVTVIADNTALQFTATATASASWVIVSASFK